MQIKVSISPYGFKEEKILAGKMVEGKFVPQKGWRVLEDDRLKVTRTYAGGVGRRSTTHYYTINVPEDYPLVIVHKYKTDLELMSPRWEYEIIYPSN